MLRTLLRLMPVFILTLLLSASSAKAEQVSYQGILTNAGGDTLLNGMFDLAFAIFPTEAGGTAIWTETHTDVDVVDGIYALQLGSITDLPDMIPADHWLEITVDATTLTPRLLITADFRAITALHAENADSVNGIPAAATPTPGHLVPLGTDGVFPEEVMPFRADSVLAGAGLVSTVTATRGGANSRSLDENVSLDVGAGEGITVTPNAIEANLGDDIQTAEIDNLAITTAKIAANAVTTTEIANNAVTTAKINAAAVTTAKIAANAVTSAELANNAVTNPKLANNAVNSAKIADGSVATADLANNAVTTGKVLDNTLVVADIMDDVVSSVDGVVNDGGDIDLVAGANITIVPDDANDRITISSTNNEYFEGDCIDIDEDNVISADIDVRSASDCIEVDDFVTGEGTCVWELDFNLGTEDSDCIDLTFDQVNCLLEAELLLNLIEGNCIDIEEGAEGCNYTISVEPDCLDSLIRVVFDTLNVTIDSTFDSEIYARSFVVTESPLDGTTEGANGHWHSDGTIEVYGDGGDTVRINPDGTMDIIHDGVRVAGIDADGEMEAHSFEVIDAEGNVVAHITQDGTITNIQDVPGTSGTEINPDGTINVVQDGQIVGGIDENGEIFARSFYVKNASGDTLAHITSTGQIEGSGVTVSNGSSTTDIDPGSVTTGSGSSSTTQSPSGVVVAGPNSGVSIQSNGTWFATQNGQIVAGLDNHGEIHAKSFYIQVGSDTLVHITNDGYVIAQGDTLTSGGGSGEGSIITRTDGDSESRMGSDGFETESEDGMSGVTITPDGKWTATQGGEIVSGVDENGEVFGRSFYVKNADGDTLAHLMSDGTFEMKDSEQNELSMGADGLGIFNDDGFISVDPTGVLIIDGETASGHHLHDDGTWQVSQNGDLIAGLDSTGEMYAKSFEVRDSSDGEIIAHLTNDGDLVLPTGAQVTIGGVPIGGGEGETITRDDGDSFTELDANGVTTGSFADGNSVTISQNGTWTATQDDIQVAGLDENAELYAASFYVKDPDTGDTLAHLTNEGNLEAAGVEADVISGSEVVVGNPDELSGSGLRANGDGTLGLFQSGNQIVDVALDTYLRLLTCMWMGEFLWGFDPSYVFLNGNLWVHGFFQFDGALLGTPQSNGDYMSLSSGTPEPGMVMVLDPNSDGLMPCYDSYQTSVIGVKSPFRGLDESGKTHVITHGSEFIMPPEEGESTTVEVPIKVKVDASYGSIKRGDLLTTSSTEGHAMLASDPKLGTIVGKALESLDSGRGEIKVMVTLN